MPARTGHQAGAQPAGAQNHAQRQCAQSIADKTQLAQGACGAAELPTHAMESSDIRC